MKGIVLDDRLRSVLDCINDVDTLADVGCDHGKLGIEALLEKRTKKLISIDISEKSLQKTIALSDRCGVEVTTILNDGLKGISEKIDLAVIAGMGANEIVKIIDESDNINSWLLVPHQDVEVLRSYLSGKYYVEKDYAVGAGKKYYNVIYAKASENVTYYNKNQLHCGLNLPNSKDYLGMLKNVRERLKIITDSNVVPKGEITVKLEEIDKECKRLGI